MVIRRSTIQSTMDSTRVNKKYVQPRIKLKKNRDNCIYLLLVIIVNGVVVN